MGDKLLHEAIERDAGPPLTLGEVLAIGVLAIFGGVWGVLAATTSWLWYEHGPTWPVAAATGFTLFSGAALVAGAVKAIEGRRARREAWAYEPSGTSPPEPEARDPILFKPYAPKRLEPPSAFIPEVMIVLLKELWEHGRLSRREVMGLRLPSGQTISRAMWERLIGGYTDSIGNEKPGLLAEAGLVIRTNTGSWQWREGLSLESVMNCFDWGDPQIEAPKPSQDVGGAGWAGRTQEERGTPSLAEQRRARWLECGCDVERYLNGPELAQRRRARWLAEKMRAERLAREEER